LAAQYVNVPEDGTWFPMGVASIRQFVIVAELMLPAVIEVLTIPPYVPAFVITGPCG
jgi:hypothetical protein